MESTVQLQPAQSTCALCLTPFSPTSQPRMLPHCPHSACTSCLSGKLGKSQSLTCQHCEQVEDLAGIDLQHFPKNISLIKKINRQHYSQLETSAGYSTATSSQVKTSVELCPLHQKELEIICLDDKQKICPHCALFGQHKDHQLKTVAETKTLMVERQQQFIQFKLKKVELQEKIGSSQFKEEVVGKINKEKERLVLDVKKKFAVLQENIKLAQKKVFEDIVRKFKSLFARITSIMKDESEAQRKYSEWAHQCGVLFNKAQKMESIEQKAGMYFGGELQVCKDGEALLKNIEETVKNNMRSIETMIGGIKIVDSTSVANSVFNYINVQVQLEEEEEKRKKYDKKPTPQKEKSAEKVIDAPDKATDIVIDKDSPSQSSDKASIKKRSAQNSPSMQKESKKQQTPTPSMLVSPQRSPRLVKQKSSTKNSKSIRAQKSPLSPRIEVRSPNRTVEARSPAAKEGSGAKDKVAVEKIIEDFCNRESADSLDLTNCGLGDQEIIEIMRYLQPRKKLKGIKLVKNRLTTQGLKSIFEYIPTVTNLNLSFNLLGDEVFSLLVENRPKVPLLRIMNLSNNKINERKGKERIDELKRMGLIVSI